MNEDNIKHFRAKTEDADRITEFMKEQGIARSTDFMHLVAEHLDAILAAENSSQIATKLSDGEGSSTLLQNGIRSDGAAADGNNSSPLGTHSGDGTLSQIATRLRGSEKALRRRNI